jgi:hypothetical protein
MFRNPVYDLMVVVPALLIAGLLSLFVMTRTAHATEAGELPATAATGTPALTASTSGTTLPDPTQRVLVVTRASLLATTTPKKHLSPLAVHTSKELLTYARQTIAEDPAIDSITLSGKGIEVAYRAERNVLGLVALAVPTRALVESDGDVRFDEPWYGRLALGERDRMKSALEVRVHTLLNSEGYLSSMQLAPATQAEILDIIRELLG